MEAKKTQIIDSFGCYFINQPKAEEPSLKEICQKIKDGDKLKPEQIAVRRYLAKQVKKLGRTEDSANILYRQIYKLIIAVQGYVRINNFRSELQSTYNIITDFYLKLVIMRDLSVTANPTIVAESWILSNLRG